MNAGRGTRTLSRYHHVKPDEYAVVLDTGPTARAPFTIAGDEIKPQPRGQGEAGLAMGYDIARPDKPPLRVSHDNSLAMNAQEGEVKEFYATPAVIAESNELLEQANSPVRLEALSHKLTVPKHGSVPPQQLSMVQPVIDGKRPPDRLSFVQLAMDVCRDAAKQIIGGDIGSVRLGSGPSEQRLAVDTTHSKVVQGTHELAQALSGGDVSVLDAAQVMKDAPSGHNPNFTTVEGRAYGEAVNRGDVTSRAQTLGINQFARAGIGEGYVTQTVGISGAEPLKDYSGDRTQEFTWGYHYAAVVADSSDHREQILMENYARVSDVREGKTRLLNKLREQFADELAGLVSAGNENQQIGEILHWLVFKLQAVGREADDAYMAMFRELGPLKSMWYFRMVGSHKGQSFHELMQRSGYFANPMTLVVSGRKPGA